MSICLRYKELDVVLFKRGVFGLFILLHAKDRLFYILSFVSIPR